MAVRHDGQAGCFYLQDATGHCVGVMEYTAGRRAWTVTRTQIAAAYSGGEVSRLLLDALVAHARQQGLRVEAACPYVQYQFMKVPKKYLDVMANPSLYGV